MGKILDELIWWMNAFQPDHSAEDAMSDFMAKDIEQKLKEESPQETITADNFFDKIKKSKDKLRQEQIEYRNKRRWDKETLEKKVQDALKESASQGSNYIMIECDDSTTGDVNLKKVKDYLCSLGFNASNLRVDSLTGCFGCYWYIKGHLSKCVD